ncbi:O-methyltransferase [Macrococcoides canis]|uniref:O-methyltransferase n=1 Tax=Macrococcoides canis TaxID=1855823 RepID=UPI00105F3055|nr:O-methyltransferase [Macrococcus canis]TDM21500.1 O-methyltransferase [Macrococcus canis]TDM43122.1 O-methyltransferase [Macrococcus canis]
MIKEATYISNLNPVNDVDTLIQYAKDYDVPIMDKISVEFVKQLIRIHKAQSILEIGTAIGYSALHFASVNSDVHVTTIERNEEMYNIAIQNFETFKTNQIRPVYKDALEAFHDVNDMQYDILFIDAAKAQSMKFFELYSPLVKQGGLIITDNILYHDFVGNIEIVRSRNIKQMVRKIEKYNTWLSEHPDYDTNFLDIGDGMSISIKK